MKKKIKTISELYKSPQGKALLFFGGYFILFCILFILMGVSSKHERSFDYESGNPYSFNTVQINNDNYKYKYIMTIDGKQEVIEGKKNNEKELFTYNNKEYFILNNNYFVKESTWIKSEVPYKNGDFLNPKKVISLISKATYESKTNYESGKNIYNFLISTNTINKEWYNIDTDYDEVPNRIVVSSDTDNSVNNIILYLDSYGILNKICKNEMKIEMSFEDFGNIKEIVNPLE